MNLTINRLLDLYSNRLQELNKKGGQSHIVEGYYQISNIEKWEISPEWVDLFVTANWKPLGMKTAPSIKLLIRLGNLYTPDSMGPKEVHPELLNKAIIEVDGADVQVNDKNGTSQLNAYCTWKILSLNEDADQKLDGSMSEDLEEEVTQTTVQDPEKINNLLDSKPDFI